MKKKLKKIALVILLIPVILLLSGAIIYWIYGLVAVGGEDTSHQSYLKNHIEEVDVQSEQSFSIFDSAFYENQVFMLGEAHGSAKPQALDLALIKHLNKKVNMRYYLAEVDYSQAHFLNQYLKTGEEELLSFVFQFWAEQNTQWGNEEFYNKIKQIRDYNQTLDSTQRISILGVDKIQDPNGTKRHLQEILLKLPTNIITEQVAGLKRLVIADTMDFDSLKVLANELLPVLINTSSADQATFDLRHTLQNIVYVDKITKRDSIMYLNLELLVRQKNLQQEKMYGMWGLFHTIPVQVERGISFAYLLQSNNSPYKNKVVSVGVYMIDSETMMSTAGLPEFIGKGERYISSTMGNHDGPMVFVKGIKDLRAVSQPNSITIFNTDATGSPYRNSSRLAAFKVLFPNQSIAFKGSKPNISKVFKYICLIRNSKALTPFQLK